MKTQIVLENIGVRFPNRVLFEGVNWSLYEGMRVALAGRNGSGKSTLLRIMAGNAESTEGRCTLVGGKQLRIGYLDQMRLDAAVLESQLLKEKSLSSLEHILRELQQNPSSNREYDYGEWQIEKTLSGLGFSKDAMRLPLHRLSGGWLVRTLIALTLLNRPDVLLLDEPTNHLDISSIQWLEEFLEKEFEGSLILVTHDVSLQKRTTDSIAILHGGHFFFRKHQNDYMTFRESLEEDKRILEKNLSGLEKKIRETEDFVSRYRAKARIATRVQSRIKTLEALKEEHQGLTDQLTRTRGYSFNLRFRFRMSEAGGKFPISAENLSFRYTDSGPWILKDLNLDLNRGQTVAIVGENGAGKTTLLNVFAQRLKPTKGQIQLGHAVEMGYFGQHQLEEISMNESLVENLRQKAPDIALEQLKAWLGVFGFPGNDDIQKKAKVLSGGERARLALLRILVTPVNVCLLDEPTNHLDVETKELLKDAIRKFEGTVILVSHDREFIQSVADRIIYLSLDHQYTDHLGTLDTFFEKYPRFVRHIEGIQLNKTTPSNDSLEPSKAKISYEERKKIKNRVRSLENKITKAESEIALLSSEKEKREKEMSSLEFYSEHTDEYRREFLLKNSEIEKGLEDQVSQWEQWSVELEELKNNQSEE